MRSLESRIRKIENAVGGGAERETETGRKGQNSWCENLGNVIPVGAHIFLNWVSGSKIL